MPKDTRDRNKYFDHKTLRHFVWLYSSHVEKAIKSLPIRDVERAYTSLTRARAFGRKVFVGGNGGSSSISDHLCCDMSKGTKTNLNKPLLVHSLNGHGALFTAIANDMGYDKTLSFQLELFGLKRFDRVVLISSSGNSPNILKAAEFAKKKKAYVIGLTGFDGGELRKMADISLHVKSENYGVIEDSHQAIMHILAQYIYLNE